MSATTSELLDEILLQVEEIIKENEQILRQLDQADLLQSKDFDNLELVF